jgi:hypothetical protein
MMPKEIQEIEIEKIHPDPLLSLHQGVTTNCSDFLGTALVKNEGCSQDVIETKGREYTNFHQANIVMKINGLSEMPIC